MQKVKISKRVGRQLYRSSPTILTVVASVGVVTTTIMAVRATPKAIKILKEAELEKGEDLSKLEIIRAAGPIYIPSVLLGVSTIACIFGANALNQKKQASLMSAYAMHFRTTMAAVLNAQYHVNRNLSVRGVCPLNEYLSFLGLDEVDGGDVIGWDICYMIEEMDCYWLDFDNHKTTLEDGLECIIIDTMALSKFE